MKSMKFAVETDGYGEEIDDNDMKMKYVLAPDNLPDVKFKTKMNVIYEFVTDKKCPFGEGLKAAELDHKYIIIFTKTDKGVVWLKRNGKQSFRPKQ